MNKSQEIYNIVDNWLSTIKNENSKKISKLFAKDGVLLGTVAENVKQGRTVIKTYFDDFKKKDPVGELNSIIFTELGRHYGVADGNYTFELNDEETDKRIKVPARFTFIVNLKTKLIVTHHSSSTPVNKLTDI